MDEDNIDCDQEALKFTNQILILKTTHCPRFKNIQGGLHLPVAE
jgi:hypothetical protein